MGMRAGERKNGLDLNRSPRRQGLWALNAPGRLLVGRRGIPGGRAWSHSPCQTKLSSGQRSLDLTVWPSRRNADGAGGASVPAPAWRALSGLARFGNVARRSRMCPEPAGRPWAA